MDELFCAALEEIALEGRNGCDIPTLWDLLEARLPFACASELPDKLRTFIWHSLIDRTLDTEVFIFCEPSTTVSVDAEKKKKTRKARIKAEDVDPDERQKIKLDHTLPHVRDLLRATQAEVRIVASEEVRYSVLGIADAGQSRYPISTIQISVLEDVAASRSRGSIQSEVCTRHHMANRNFFYITKCLEERGLILKTPIMVKVPDNHNHAVIGTNLLHLPRFAPHVRLAPDQVFKIVEPGGGASFGGEGAGDVATYAVHNESRMLKVICQKLAMLPDRVAVESELKVVLGFRYTKGHREWRRLRHKLEKGGYIHCFLAKVRVGCVAATCVKLLKDFAAKGTEGADSDDAGGADQEEGGVANTAMLVEVSLDRQMLEVIAKAGSAGILNMQVFEALGINPKKSAPLLLEVVKKFDIRVQVVNVGKTIYNRLTAGADLIERFNLCMLQHANPLQYLMPPPAAPPAEKLDLPAIEASGVETLYAMALGNVVPPAQATLQVLERPTAPKKYVNNRSFSVLQKPGGAADILSSMLATQEAGNQAGDGLAEGERSQPKHGRFRGLTELSDDRLRRILDRLAEKRFVLQMEVRSLLLDHELGAGLANSNSKGPDRKAVRRLSGRLISAGKAKSVTITLPATHSTGEARLIEVLVHPDLDMNDPDMVQEIVRKTKRFEHYIRTTSTAKAQEEKKMANNQPIDFLQHITKLLPERSYRRRIPGGFLPDPPELGSVQGFDIPPEGGRYLGRPAMLFRNGLMAPKMGRMRLLHYLLCRLVGLGDLDPVLPTPGGRPESPTSNVQNLDFQAAPGMMGSPGKSGVWAGGSCRREVMKFKFRGVPSTTSGGQDASPALPYSFTVPQLWDCFPISLAMMVFGTHNRVEDLIDLCQSDACIADLSREQQLAIFDPAARRRLAHLLFLMSRIGLLQHTITASTGRPPPLLEQVAFMTVNTSGMLDEPAGMKIDDAWFKDTRTSAADAADPSMGDFAAGDGGDDDRGQAVDPDAEVGAEDERITVFPDRPRPQPKRGRAANPSVRTQPPKKRKKEKPAVLPERAELIRRTFDFRSSDGLDRYWARLEYIHTSRNVHPMLLQKCFPATEARELWSRSAWTGSVMLPLVTWLLLNKAMDESQTLDSFNLERIADEMDLSVHQVTRIAAQRGDRTRDPGHGHRVAGLSMVARPKPSHVGATEFRCVRKAKDGSSKETKRVAPSPRMKKAARPSEALLGPGGILREAKSKRDEENSSDGPKKRNSRQTFWTQQEDLNLLTTYLRYNLRLPYGAPASELSKKEGRRQLLAHVLGHAATGADANARTVTAADAPGAFGADAHTGAGTGGDGSTGIGIEAGAGVVAAAGTGVGLDPPSSDPRGGLPGIFGPPSSDPRGGLPAIFGFRSSDPRGYHPGGLDPRSSGPDALAGTVTGATGEDATVADANTGGDGSTGTDADAGGVTAHLDGVGHEGSRLEGLASPSSTPDAVAHLSPEDVNLQTGEGEGSEPAGGEGREGKENPSGSASPQHIVHHSMSTAMDDGAAQGRGAEGEQGGREQTHGAGEGGAVDGEEWAAQLAGQEGEGRERREEADAFLPPPAPTGLCVDRGRGMHFRIIRWLRPCEKRGGLPHPFSKCHRRLMTFFNAHRQPFIIFMAAVQVACDLLAEHLNVIAAEEAAQAAKEAAEEAAQAAKKAAEEAAQAAQEAAQAAKEAGHDGAEAAEEAGQDGKEAAQETGQEGKVAAEEAGQDGKEAAQETGQEGKVAAEEAGQEGKEAAQEAGQDGEEAGQDGKVAAEEASQDGKEAAQEAGHDGKEAGQASTGAAMPEGPSEPLAMVEDPTSKSDEEREGLVLAGTNGSKYPNVHQIDLDVEAAVAENPEMVERIRSVPDPMNNLEGLEAVVIEYSAILTACCLYKNPGGPKRKRPIPGTFTGPRPGGRRHGHITGSNGQLLRTSLDFTTANLPPSGIKRKSRRRGMHDDSDDGEHALHLPYAAYKATKMSAIEAATAVQQDTALYAGKDTSIQRGYTVTVGPSSKRTAARQAILARSVDPRRGGVAGSLGRLLPGAAAAAAAADAQRSVERMVEEMTPVVAAAVEMVRSLQLLSSCSRRVDSVMAAAALSSRFSVQELAEAFVYLRLAGWVNPEKCRKPFQLSIQFHKRLTSAYPAELLERATLCLPALLLSQTEVQQDGRPRQALRIMAPLQDGTASQEGADVQDDDGGWENLIPRLRAVQLVPGVSTTALDTEAGGGPPSESGTAEVQAGPGEALPLDAGLAELAEGGEAQLSSADLAGVSQPPAAQAEAVQEAVQKLILFDSGRNCYSIDGQLEVPSELIVSLFTMVTMGQAMLQPAPHFYLPGIDDGFQLGGTMPAGVFPGEELHSHSIMKGPSIPSQADAAGPLMLANIVVSIKLTGPQPTPTGLAAAPSSARTTPTGLAAASALARLAGLPLHASYRQSGSGFGSGFDSSVFVFPATGVEHQAARDRVTSRRGGASDGRRLTTPASQSEGPESMDVDALFQAPSSETTATGRPPLPRGATGRIPSAAAGPCESTDPTDFSWLPALHSPDQYPPLGVAEDELLREEAESACFGQLAHANAAGPPLALTMIRAVGMSGKTLGQLARALPGGGLGEEVEEHVGSEEKAVPSNPDSSAYERARSALIPLLSFGLVRAVNGFVDVHFLASEFSQNLVLRQKSNVPQFDNTPPKLDLLPALEAPLGTDVMVRPWLDHEGSINSPLLRLLIRRVLSFVECHPGVTEELLLSHMDCVCQRSAKELLQVLVLCNHLTLEKRERPTRGVGRPSLLRRPLSSTTTTHASGPLVVHYFPVIGASLDVMGSLA